MTEEYKRIQYGLRFLNINDAERNIIEKELAGYSPKYGKFFKNKTNHTVIIRLNSSGNYEQLYSFIENHQEFNKRYDIYISLVTNRDHDGFSVDEYVTEVIKKTDAPFGFSCTMV